MWFINLFVILCYIIIGIFCVAFAVTELLLTEAFVITGVIVVSVIWLCVFLYELIFK